MREGSPMMGEASVVMREGSPVMPEGSAVMREGPAVMGEGSPVMREGPAVMGEGSAVMGEGSPVVREGSPVMGEGPAVMPEASAVMPGGIALLRGGAAVMQLVAAPRAEPVVLAPRRKSPLAGFQKGGFPSIPGFAPAPPAPTRGYRNAALKGSLRRLGASMGTDLCRDLTTGIQK